MNITKKKVDLRIQAIFATYKSAKIEYPQCRTYENIAFGQLLELSMLNLISQKQLEELKQQLDNV